MTVAQPKAPPPPTDSGVVQHAGRPARGGRVLFRVPFTSAMDDADAVALARMLDLVTHLHPKLYPSPTSPGVVRLDFDSGLFVERGETDGSWVLEGRTWGDPPTAMVRQWYLRATAAGHHFDPLVTSPEPVAVS